ncbi:hypothetical protein JCM14244_03590 [Venenivibrio stagnispumantis]|uniref:Uncharacterized OsmC-related protein n=1 Tax=Venenivibrio stagnispumantis TaxID=407998 RepID=A0AA46AEN8_9AQUI|nr:OsmC family protein [Venenivibrio stagnispumantis]MCW4572793.1 OsmC family protein [Venenivibrio stagnispumantis]SMP13771.1 Uncharacterized OsmC-related protein [Venenivibrio stagnispumantis]
MENKEKVVNVSLENDNFIAKSGEKSFNISDLGVSASELYLISIAHCFATTVKAYVNHKGLKIENLNVEVKGKKHENENRYETVEINVSFDGDLTKEQIERILVIGKRGCTVGNSSSAGVNIQTKYTGSIPV